MLRFSKRILTHSFIVVVFIMACVAGFYIIYWVDIPNKPIKSAREEINSDLTFRGEVQRFLTVYFSQDFVKESDRLNFVKVEFLRFADYPLKDETELVLRDELLTNLEQIIIKSRDVSFDITGENKKLKALLIELQ